MDGILVLLSMIVKITIMGFATFVILHIARNMKKRAIRDDISRIEAKMAAYRINLKNRVKKKAKRFRATYPSAITAGEPIDVSLTRLSELSFEKNSDFQDYIDLCKQINSLINLASADKNQDPHQEKVSNLDKIDFMGTDFKNEINIVRLINDMVTVSKALTKLMSRFNHFDKKARLNVPESINFASLFELQKVFKSKEAQEHSIDKFNDDNKAAA